MMRPGGATTRTPWGDTRQLRAERLHSGTQPHGREQTEQHQRRRLFGGMVAAVQRDGYAKASVRRVRRECGVTPSELYKLYDSKEECFLAAVDAVYKDGLQSMWAASRSARGVEQGLRAALEAICDSVAAQPEAARMALVYVYEAGERGLQRAEAATASFEVLLSECLARSRRSAGLPAGLPGAIAGAVQMLIHEKLRHNQHGTLPAVAQQMADWTLSYSAPPVPLARSRTRVRPARREPAADAGERLLDAIAELSARKGYRHFWARELAGVAKTSLSVLYERYGGKEQCFLAAFEMTRQQTLAAALAAYEPLMDDWPRALHAAIDAITRHFASEPDLARLVAVEVLAVGPVAFAARDEAIRSFAGLVEPGYQHAPRAPELAREAIPFGVYAMIHHHLASGRPASTLPQLTPTATFFALAPYLGAAQAGRVAGEKVTPAARTQRRAASA